MKDELTHTWRSLSPLAVVLVALLSLALFPVLIQRHTAELRSQITEVAEPARDLIREFELALAFEVASTRGLLLTRNQEYANIHEIARARRLSAHARLLPLAGRLGPQVRADATRLGAELRPIDALVDALYAGRISHAQYLERLDEQQAAFENVILASVALDQAIGREVSARRSEIDDAERFANIVTVLLVAMALAAALVVARLGRDYRLLAVRLDGIMASITDAFFTVDRDWRFTYVNSEAERLIQRPRDELIGRSLWEEFPGVRGSRFDHEYHRAIAEQRTVQFEEYYPPFSMWVHVRVYPTRDGISVYFVDITARKQAEERIRESERNFRALGNSIPQLAWMADNMGRIFWYNDRWYEYTGITPEETTGWGWQNTLDPEHVERVLQQFRHAIATGQPWEDTFPIRGRSGEYRWFLSRALPIVNSTGNIVRWFGTNTDVTERMEAAAEREQLLEREREARAESESRRTELERVTESRARLMRGFSHDVKNPLGAADGYLQLLEEGIMDPLTDRQQASIGKVRRSIRAALDLIDDLLELARAEAGAMNIEHAPTNVRQVALEAAEEYRAQAEARGLTLTVDLADDLPVFLSDARRIRQVIGNFLSNAVKYTPHGSVTLKASVAMDNDAPRPGRWIAIAVADTGPGISAQQQQLLFQEFRRLDNVGAQKGMGIGLAISQKIAHALKGAITLKSEPGRGSVFTLWLPLSG